MSRSAVASSSRLVYSSITISSRGICNGVVSAGRPGAIHRSQREICHGFSTIPLRQSVFRPRWPILDVASKESRRYNSLSSHSRPLGTDLPSSLNPAQQKAYARLRPVVDSFRAPIDWAVAYGSGVINQANTSASAEVRPPRPDSARANDNRRR
jgi:hypothetical protein